MLPDASFSASDSDETFTDQWYALLPAFMRNLDAGTDLQLYRFMDALGRQGEQVAQLAAEADSGRLTDPDLVPERLLPWLAQMVGVSAPSATPPAVVRSRIADLQAVGRPGSGPAIAAVVRPLLTDTKWVSVVPHYGGDPWTIGVMVRTAEAPEDLQSLAEAIIADGQKPAGWTLQIVGVGSPWSAFDALGATWDEGDAAGGSTWQDEERATWVV